jgi:hypothetical protein
MTATTTYILITLLITLAAIAKTLAYDNKTAFRKCGFVIVC